jgi:hypothetical protein
MSIKQQNAPRPSFCGSLALKHYSVTAILAEKIEIFKPALAASFKFLMAVIIPVMAHYFLPILVSPLGHCK